MRQQLTTLIATAGGIGDIIRTTPLIRVFHEIGYEVDVLLAPDYHETALLLEGAPEIRRLYVAHASHERGHPRPAYRGEVYDIAVFTLWGERLNKAVQARRIFSFNAGQWKQHGDIACIRDVARSIGWSRELPSPFAIASSREFDLSPETVALHPGCKTGWPWKKWHGFDSLARLIPNVAIVGAASDLDNARTYFREPFEWPAHAVDFSGKLNLPDTAALIKQCAALVSNDSGLMHLGVALGIPVFGVFGLTSPVREAMPEPNMHAITKGLQCEPACRRQPWGRRDCSYSLECLKTLNASEVFARLGSVLSGASVAVGGN